MSCDNCGNCGCGKNQVPTIGWSQFALDRHKKGTGHSYAMCPNDVVESLVCVGWKDRIPGDGETDLSRKVLVPVRPTFFVCPTIDIEKLDSNSAFLDSEIKRRQEGEDEFISNFVRHDQIPHAAGLIDKAKHVKVVLYSAEALTENGGERSTDCDWEIVCIIASPVDKEPMPPLTMARNMLEKPGGTKSTYTAEEFAESIYYWSKKVRVK